MAGARWQKYRKIVQGLSIYAKWAWADVFDLLRGRRILTPPKHIRRQVGPFDSPLLYRQTAKQTTSYIREVGGLMPHERILDLGCGCGRVAAALIHYLDRRGSYEGLDISPELIRWCADEIEAKHPNFRFQRADVLNDAYNPGGAYKGSEFQFPYPDDSLDFVFAGSLFTHLLPNDSENYLKEIGRVLRKGGRCLITYFLLNDESTRQIQEGLSSYNFTFPIGEALVLDEQAPEAAVAYPEDWVLDLYERNGLRVVEPVYYGSWCGRPKPFKWSNQDMILAVKE